MPLATLRSGIGAATLEDGTPISATAARRIACDAQIMPAVLGSRGEPLDVGRGRRLFTGPLRRALVLRDRGCTFPGCDRPPRWCDAHHVVPWALGGTTALHNGVLLCGHHHRLIEAGDWQVTFAPDGIPEFHPHPGSTPTAHHCATSCTTTRPHGDRQPPAPQRRTRRPVSGFPEEADRSASARGRSRGVRRSGSVNRTGGRGWRRRCGRTRGGAAVGQAGGMPSTVGATRVRSAGTAAA